MKISRLCILISIFVFSQVLYPDYEGWMGVYLKGQKIGYTYWKIESENDRYIFIERNFLVLNMLGMEKKITMFTRVYTDKEFRLLDFDFELLSGDQRVNMKGKREGDKILLDIKGREKKSFDYTPETYLLTVYRGLLLMNKIREVNRIVLLDPSTLSLSEGKVSYLGEKTIEQQGKTYKTEVFKLSYLGTETKTYIHSNRILKEESPMDMVSIEEPRDKATEITGRKVDLLYLFSVKTEGEIEQSDRAKGVKLRIKNIQDIQDQLNLEFATQSILEKGKDWSIIEILSPDKLPGFDKISVSPDSLLRYTMPEPFIESDALEIEELSQKITEGEKTLSDKARAIMHWVYNNLEKRPTVSIPSATDVLKMGYGDCNEHSILFAALARAIGIPTRIVVGLVYQSGAYFYHAWDAVYIGNKWIFIDPVYNEFPASPLHLMLKLGNIDKQVELVSVVGKLKIEILDVTY